MISFILRESPMLTGLQEGILVDLRNAGIGRVLDADLFIDDSRGRLVIGIVGEVCRGEVALHIFTGFDIQASANAWIAKERLGELKGKLVRADGQFYLLLMGRKRNKTGGRSAKASPPK